MKEQIKKALEYLEANTITGHFVAIDILKEILQEERWNLNTSYKK